MCARRTFALLIPFALAGCDDGFAKPSLLDSLRVLAVQATPASGSPAGSSRLELVHSDGTRRADGALLAPRSVQIAWFGGCHNPPTRQFFGCYPILNLLAQQLAPK